MPLRTLSWSTTRERFLASRRAVQDTTLGFFYIVGEQGRGELGQGGGQLPQAVEADKASGEHVVPQSDGVLQLV